METSKNSTAATELRARANEAVAEWRAAVETHKTAMTAFRERRDKFEKEREPFRALSPTKRLELISLELAELAFEDRTWELGRIAAIALQAAEVAEGDELAMAADPALTLSAYDADVADIGRLDAELQAAKSRIWKRIKSANDAFGALNARRVSANLPGAICVPSAGTPDIREKLARAAATGPAIRSNADRIRQLRREDVETRADLERQYREEEELKAFYARRDAERRAAEQREQEAGRASHARDVAKRQAEQRKLEEMAAAQRAREANGTTR